ncbi:MAG: gluconeogenesis factor YvcK family protein [Patescibacteria group bacterium]
MKKIVTIGGGTGHFAILSGLKNLPDISLSAIVTMSDDGGSSGPLRHELGVLPPGDVRQCLVALSESDDVVKTLMNYRFREGNLSGHSVGNILLAGLEKVTGNFQSGLDVASDLLKVRGTVIPVTDDNAILAVSLLDGSVIEGQVNIGRARIREVGLDKIFYTSDVRLSEKARQAIVEADYIIISPGDYYESIIPALIVGGFKEALSASAAAIVFPINLTNKEIHMKHWKASDYIKNIETYLGKRIDVILINSEKPSLEQEKQFDLKKESGILVEDDINDERAIRKPLLSSLLFDHVRSFLRHDPSKFAEAVSSVIEK